MTIGSYAKALVAAGAAGTAVLLTAMDDNMVTTGEWIGVAGAVLGALGITWVVPNAAKSDLPESRSGAGIPDPDR